MKNFRTLDLAVELHEETQKLKIEGHLKDQLLRAVTSIALNLSEGNAKYSVKEKKRFYQIAYASLKESQTIFRLMGLKEHHAQKTADHLGACLYKLIDSKLTEIRKPQNSEF